MEPLYNQLIELLEQETFLYRDLLAILRDETDRLVANDAMGLLKVTRRKDTIALRIRSLEESRYLLMEKFGAALGRPGDGLTVSDLCAVAPEALRDRLCPVRDTARAVVEKATALNTRNGRLAESSMRLLHGAMETLHQQLRSACQVVHGYGPRKNRLATSAVGGVMVSHQV